MSIETNIYPIHETETAESGQTDTVLDPCTTAEAEAGNDGTIAEMTEEEIANAKEKIEAEIERIQDSLQTIAEKGPRDLTGEEDVNLRDTTTGIPDGDALENEPSEEKIAA